MKRSNITKNFVKLLMSALMIAVFSVRPTAAQSMVATTTLPAYRPTTGFSAGPRTVKVNVELVDGRWWRGVICLPDVSWEGYRYNGILYTDFVNENNWLKPYTISGTIVVNDKWKIPIETYTLPHGEQCTTPKRGGEPIGIPDDIGKISELTSLRLESFRIDHVNRNPGTEAIIEKRLEARKKLDVLKQQVASAETATENELQILLNKLLDRWPTEELKNEAEALAAQVQARMAGSEPAGQQQDNYSSGYDSQTGSDDGSNKNMGQIADFLETQARQQAEAEDAIADFTNAVTDLAGTIISEYHREQREKAAEEAEERAEEKRDRQISQARLNEHDRKRSSLERIRDAYRQRISLLLTGSEPSAVSAISDINQSEMEVSLASLLEAEREKSATLHNDSVFVMALLAVPIRYLPDNHDQISYDYLTVRYNHLDRKLTEEERLTDDEVWDIAALPGTDVLLSQTQAFSLATLINAANNDVDREVLTYLNPWAPPYAENALLIAENDRAELERIKSLIAGVEAPNIFINGSGIVEEVEALHRLRTYLRYYPTGRLAANARAELAEIEERRYQALERGANRFAIAKFIEEFPDNPHVPALSKRLASLTTLHNYQSQIYELESDLISYRASKDVFLWGGVITGSLSALAGGLSDLPALTGGGLVIGGSFVLYSLYKMSQISSTKQKLQRLRNEGPQLSLLPGYDIENEAFSMGLTVKF
ncbi:MAG TPA: hypothetical protein VF181_03620 [Balneolaceae bacterium]